MVELETVAVTPIQLADSGWTFTHTLTVYDTEKVLYKLKMCCWYTKYKIFINKVII